MVIINYSELFFYVFLRFDKNLLFNTFKRIHHHKDGNILDVFFQKRRFLRQPIHTNNRIILFKYILFMFSGQLQVAYFFSYNSQKLKT